MRSRSTRPRSRRLSLRSPGSSSATSRTSTASGCRSSTRTAPTPRRPAYETLLAKTYDAVKAAQPRMQVIGAALSPHGGRQPRRRAADALADGLHPRPRRRLPRERTDDADHGRLRHSIRTATTRASRRRRRARVDDDRARRLRQARHAARRRRSTERRSRARRCRSSTTSTASSRGSPPTARRSTPAASRRRPSPSTRRRRPRTTRSRSQTAFCQPNVVGILLFHAFDESDLDRWQSGLYYANRTPKASLPAVRDAAQRSAAASPRTATGSQLTPQLRYLYWPRGKLLRQGHVRVAVHVRHRLPLRREGRDADASRATPSDACGPRRRSRTSCGRARTGSGSRSLRRSTPGCRSAVRQQSAHDRRQVSIP